MICPNGHRDDTAAARLRELGIVFWLAVTQLEHAESLVGAVPWLARAAALAPARTEATA